MNEAYPNIYDARKGKLVNVVKQNKMPCMLDQLKSTIESIYFEKSRACFI